MENAKYAVLLLMWCGLAQAEGDVKTLGDLDRLQSGRVFYDAQAAFNKARLAAGQADTAAVPASPVIIPVPGTPSSTTVAPAAGTVLPVLEKVAGQVATLSFPDGSSTMVRTGDSVQGGYKVVSVTLRGVVVRRVQDGHDFTLN
ncbi:type IV pilus biogenesis protein PilP [Erwinia persicina]|uniref:type IV pilus biogenesis protein PilP n=1 Tax=Erwinia persicina TaxID=55211 RepID=UPI001784926B|nr:type IV pilus biogenesis protein PilP [Erwinia persicina]MBD8165374.1 type IV pilus biogenesis protein PilP [Erwinia persicina]